MKPILFLAAILLSLAPAAPAQARDARVQFEIASAIAQGKAQGVLDGSVVFHFEGQATPAVLQDFGAATTQRKTHAIGKSQQEACDGAFLGALVALQEAAKARGANAVVGLRSHFKGVVYSSPTRYECGAGRRMVGVALLGSYARVADR